MDKKRPLIAIPIGDPAGIGPEIVIKALEDENIHKTARCVVVGDRRIIENSMKICRIHMKIHVIERPDEGDYQKGILNLINIDMPDMEGFQYGVINAAHGRAAYQWIEKAVGLAMVHQVDAVCTTPINKEALRAAGVPFIGHTEIFGYLTKTEDPLTLFVLDNLRIIFLSRHVSLRKACDMVRQDRIISYVERGVGALRQIGIAEPRIAVAGLNPHCGEHGLFGEEEETEIRPAVLKLQEKGYDVSGPIGADSVFYQARQGRYDCVISMYHDQGHIASKTVDFVRTVSVTLGMPILRTSVDHGTAFDIAGKGIASPVSMLEAIAVSARYALNFNGYIKK